MFDSNIKFKYTWRPYQERTLKNIHKYLKDKKIHIVAAPGSGKTILGLELARLLKEPVLILAPTVTIKNQWIDRFISSFTNYKEVPDWISTDVYNLKFFNVTKNIVPKNNIYIANLKIPSVTNICKYSL